MITVAVSMVFKHAPMKDVFLSNELSFIYSSFKLNYQLISNYNAANILYKAVADPGVSRRPPPLAWNIQIYGRFPYFYGYEFIIQFA